MTVNNTVVNLCVYKLNFDKRWGTDVLHTFKINKNYILLFFTLKAIYPRFAIDKAVSSKMLRFLRLGWGRTNTSPRDLEGPHPPSRLGWGASTYQTLENRTEEAQ